MRQVAGRFLAHLVRTLSIASHRSFSRHAVVSIRLTARTHSCRESSQRRGMGIRQVAGRVRSSQTACATYQQLASSATVGVLMQKREFENYGTLLHAQRALSL